MKLLRELLLGLIDLILAGPLRPEEQLLAGPAWTDEDWVVADALGRVVRPDRLGKLFDRLAASAGLPRITIRQLRHSHATALLAAGESPKVVQERLGHASIGVTLDVYSAVLPNMQRAAVDRLARIMDAGSIGAV